MSAAWRAVLDGLQAVLDTDVRSGAQLARIGDLTTRWGAVGYLPPLASLENAAEVQQEVTRCARG